MNKNNKERWIFWANRYVEYCVREERCGVVPMRFEVWLEEELKIISG